MTTVYVGLPTLHGDVGRYAASFDLLEVKPVDTPLPRPSRLRQWRKEVPPAFVFSVVLPAVVAELKPSAEVDAALKTALDAAVALQARCLVLTTPVSVTPTALHRKRLATLLERLPRDAVTVGWEPRGVWAVDEAAALARELDISLIIDAAQDAPPRGMVLYTRLRGIGASARLGPAAVTRVREAMQGRREVFVVVETSGPKKVAEALRAPLEGPSRVSTGAIIRPQVRISAEDEEQ